MPARYIGEYEVLSGIGYGRAIPQTQVKLGRHRETKQQVAIKLIHRADLTERMVADLDREVTAMRLLDHDSIVRMLDVFWDVKYPSKDGTRSRHVVALVLELAEGGDLFDYMYRTGRPLPEPLARIYFRQLLLGLQHMHSKGIAHRDLKPENCVLDGDFNLKITDMGLSGTLTDEEGHLRMLRTSCGTFGYMAPEVMVGPRYHGAPADVWGAGVILFLMLAGRPPFVCQKNAHETTVQAAGNDWWFRCIIEGRNDLFWAAVARTVDLPAAAIALIDRIFCLEPGSRATVEQLLEDPWLNAGAEEDVDPEVLIAEMMRRKAAVDADVLAKRAQEKRKFHLDAEKKRGTGPSDGSMTSTASAPLPVDAEDTKLEHSMDSGVDSGMDAGMTALDLGTDSAGSGASHAEVAGEGGVGAGAGTGSFHSRGGSSRGLVFDPFAADVYRAMAASVADTSARSLLSAAAAAELDEEAAASKLAPIAGAADGAAATGVKRFSQVRCVGTSVEVMERVQQSLSLMCARYTIVPGSFKVKASVLSPGGDVKVTIAVFREPLTPPSASEGKTAAEAAVAADGDEETPAADSEEVHAEDDGPCVHLVDVRRHGAPLENFYRVFEGISDALADVSADGKAKP